MVRRQWLWVVIIALAALTLVVGAPAWAATSPIDQEQGTVPPPPGGGDDDGGSDDNGDDGAGGGGGEAPTVTPTPGDTILPPPAQDAGAQGSVPPANLPAVVLVPRLNVRSGPGVTFSVVGGALQGQQLQVQYRNATNDWWYSCCVTGTTTSGWVSAALVQPGFDAARSAELLPIAPVAVAAAAATPVPGVAVAPGALNAIVNVAQLNVRSEPSTNGIIQGQLVNGASVRVLARNAAGDWWNVCCLPGSSAPGWVFAQFLTPSFAAGTAIPLAGQATAPVTGSSASLRALLPTPTPKPTRSGAILPTPTPRATVGSASSITATAPLTTASPISKVTPATTTLGLRMWQEPPFAQQGDAIEVRYVVSNTGQVAAKAVELRNEVPSALVLGSGKAARGGRFVPTKDLSGTAVYSFIWPTLAPGAAVTASVAMTLGSDIANGAIVDNLVALDAANADLVSGGVMIGLPPQNLPDF
jgi:uncharacterized protein YraI